jgi:DNA-binding protein HU-beta
MFVNMANETVGTVANKDALVNHIAATTGLTKKASKQAFEALFDGITSNLSNGYDVNISGYLNIEVVPVPEHTARNPQTGGSVVVPAGFKLRTRAMSKLQEAIGR